MIEFKLPNFNENQYDYLHKLYKHILYQDKQWHFFYEGKYTLIRVSKIFENMVAHHLRLLSIPFINMGDFKENIYITQKYLPIFKAMFHCFSELAMNMLKEETQEFWWVLNRITHCSLNNLRLPNRVKTLSNFSADNDLSYILWESMCLSFIANERAFIIGSINKTQK